MPTLRLNAVLGLNKTGFDAGMTAANKQVERFGAGLRSHLAGAFSAAAIVGFTKSIVTAGSEIKDLSDRLSVLPKDVQEFGLAAKLGGQSADTFARALERIRLAMADGKNPLEAFGITMKEMQAGDAVSILRKLAVELENFAGSAEQTKALADAFGARGMGAVVNMLRELRSAQGGLFFTDKDVEALDKAGDAATKFWNSMKIGALRAFEWIGNKEHDLIDFLFDVDLKNRFGKKGGGGGRGGPTPVAENMEAQAKAVEELSKLKKATDELNEKNRVAQLTDEERLNELMAERIELVRRLQFALTDKDAAEIQFLIAQNDASVLGLLGKAKPGATNGSGSGINDNPLGSIGAFTGGTTQNSNGAQALQSLKRIESALIQKGIIVRDTR